MVSMWLNFCRCLHAAPVFSHFVLQGYFDKARIYFERSKDFDFQSLYQLSVMLYDGIGGDQDTVSNH